jgi:hydrogenase maturation protease
MSTPRTLIVGIGSPHGDDQIGWRVANTLRFAVSPANEVREASTPSQLLDWLDGVDRLIVCDACQVRRRGPDDSSGDALRVHRWQRPTLQVSMLRSAGSHSFGLPQVLQLAERLGSLPQEVIVFGIEGRQFDAFASLSQDTESLIATAVQAIADEPGVGPVPTDRLNPAHQDDGRWEPALRDSVQTNMPSREESRHA